jgi:hypothetical protein
MIHSRRGVNATLCGGTSKTLPILHRLIYCSVYGAVSAGGL